jgi:hypothetical protein
VYCCSERAGCGSLFPRLDAVPEAVHIHKQSMLPLACCCSCCCEPAISSPRPNGTLFGLNPDVPSLCLSAAAGGLFAAALIRLRLRLLQYFISRDCSCNSILQLQQCFHMGSRTSSGSSRVQCMHGLLAWTPMGTPHSMRDAQSGIYVSVTVVGSCRLRNHELCFFPDGLRAMLFHWTHAPVCLHSRYQLP